MPTRREVLTRVGIAIGVGALGFGAYKAGENSGARADVPPSSPSITPSTTPSVVPSVAPVCQSAEQLGPWPPEANGQFHNIEIDGTQKGATVSAQLWLPDGPAKTEYWIDMSGRRVTFKNAAGTAFQWNGECNPDTLKAELAAAKARRVSEEVTVVELALADFMQKYPGRVTLMPGDGVRR